MVKILTPAVSGLTFTVTSNSNPHRKQECIRKLQICRSPSSPKIRTQVSQRECSYGRANWGVWLRQTNKLHRYAPWFSTAEAAADSEGGCSRTICHGPLPRRQTTSPIETQCQTLVGHEIFAYCACLTDSYRGRRRHWSRAGGSMPDRRRRLAYEI